MLSSAAVSPLHLLPLGLLLGLRLYMIVASEGAHGGGAVRDPALVDAHVLHRLAQHAVDNMERAVGGLRKRGGAELAALALPAPLRPDSASARVDRVEPGLLVGGTLDWTRGMCTTWARCGALRRSPVITARCEVQCRESRGAGLQGVRGFKGFHSGCLQYVCNWASTCDSA